jgi:predicted HAD superfamily hydrolase
VIEPIAGMQDLFNEVRSTGRRVILTSDMYLPACGMRTLLESAGYDLTGVWLCVSSEVGLLKATGRLYRHWLAAEDTRAAAAVHIGDDFHVDYVAAWRAGLSTIHFASPAASRRRLAALSPWQRACEGFRRLRARLGMTLDAWKHC